MWWDLVLFAGISLFLYHSSFLLFLFLVPLEIASVKRGLRGGAVSAGITLAGILMVKLVGIASLDGPDTALIFVDFVVPVLFVAALLFVEADGMLGLSRVYRLILSVIVIGLGFIPVYLYLQSSGIIADLFTEQLGLAAAVVGQNVEAEQARAVMETATEVFLRVYVFGFAVILAANWYLGRRIGTRLGESNRAVPSVRAFRAPTVLLWPTGIAALLVLASLFVELGAFEYLGWNAALLGLFLLGIQGFGAFQGLLDRTGAPPWARVTAMILLIVVLFSPGVNLVVLLGLPALAIAEHWIQIR